MLRVSCSAAQSRRLIATADVLPNIDWNESDDDEATHCVGEDNPRALVPCEEDNIVSVSQDGEEQPSRDGGQPPYRTVVVNNTVRKERAAFLPGNYLLCYTPATEDVQPVIDLTESPVSDGQSRAVIGYMKTSRRRVSTNRRKPWITVDQTVCKCL